MEIEQLFTKLVRNQSSNTQFSEDNDTLKAKIKGKLNELKLILGRCNTKTIYSLYLHSEIPLLYNLLNLITMTGNKNGL